MGMVGGVGGDSVDGCIWAFYQEGMRWSMASVLEWLALASLMQAGYPVVWHRMTHNPFLQGACNDVESMEEVLHAEQTRIGQPCPPSPSLRLTSSWARGQS